MRAAYEMCDLSSDPILLNFRILPGPYRESGASLKSMKKARNIVLMFACLISASITTKLSYENLFCLKLY